VTAIERRRYVRIAPKGSVSASVEGNMHVGRIANLSAGGAFMIVAMTDSVGTAIDVEIRVDASKATWLKTTGRLVRVEPDGVAIRFDTASEQLVKMIDELTTHARGAVRVTSIILIDVDTQRRSAMSAGLRAAGCTVVEASTPLEAIVRLGESSFEPDVIAISDSGTSLEAEAMRVFIARAHSHARLITIDDDLFAPDGISKWLSSDPKTDLSSTGREVLVRERAP
jgi:hypothetical protein